MATEVVSFRADSEVLRQLKKAGLNPAEVAREGLDRRVQGLRLKRLWNTIDALKIPRAPPGTAVRLIREARDELEKRSERR
jgi:hypothetical protein